MTVATPLKTIQSELSVETYGDSSHPAIVFLHGAGVSSWMWNEQVEMLKASYYCITVDLPGNGESHTSEWVSFQETADQIASIIETHAPEGQAHVVGLSLGGYVTLNLLAQHPDLVQSAIISGVTTQPFDKQWLYRPLLTAMIPLVKWDMMIKFNIKMMNLPEDVIPMYHRDSKRTSLIMLRRVYDELMNYRMPESLHDVPHRVLGVAGEHENNMVKDSLQAYQRIPNGEAYIVDEAHHGWNGEFPSIFTEMIHAWITQEPLPDALKPI